MKDISDFNLLNHNTFGIDAKCSRFLEYESLEEAQKIARRLKEPYLLIGKGSNLLLTGDFKGLVVHSAVKGIEIQGDSRIRCGSGETWDDVVAWTVNHGFYGAENLSLIPGEVGASAIQNIGAYGAEVKDLIVAVEAVEIGTGQVFSFTNEDCCYGYRDSRFKHDWKNKYLITHVVYQLTTDETKQSTTYGNIRNELQRKGIEKPSAVQLREVVIAIRKEKLPDPKELGNAGSFFMNPVVGREKFEQLLTDYPLMPHYYIDAEHEKIPAGWMIEQCGWKGRSLGRAGVHDRQALVLVNRGGATGNEIVTLCQAIQSDVYAKFGILIHPEVNIV